MDSEIFTVRGKAFDHLFDAVVVTDLLGNIIDWNQGSEILYGYSKEQAIGQPVNILHVPEDTIDITTEVLSTIKKEGKWSGEIRMLHKDGSIGWIESICIPSYDENNQIVGAIGINRDITQRKQSEERVKNEKNRLRTILDLVGDPIFVKDNEHRITIANRAFYDLFDLDEDHVIGKTLMKNVPENEKNQFLEIDRLVLDTGISDLREEKLTINDFTRTIVTRKVRFIDEFGKRYLVGSIHDITERVRLENQLRTHQQMDSIGTLVGGISHDFNNILAALKGNIDLLSMSNENFTYNQKKYLESASKSSVRAVELIRRLQTLSSATVSNTTIIDIYDIAEEVFGFISVSTNKLINKQINFNKGDFLVSANAGELHQVLLNLATNSIQSIEAQDVTKNDFIRITASTYQSRINDDTGLKVGDYVHLEFKDSGFGMSAEVLKNAFIPMFTTKNKNSKRGQGLGLAIVYNIITKHNDGFIRIASKKGKGTTFHLYLPKAEVDTEITVDSTKTPASIGGTETLLVIDDDILVAEFVEAILTGAGYTVLIAKDGIEALEIYKQKMDLIAAVILDLNMPKMSGTQVFKELIKIDPKIKIIISSGYGVEDSHKGILSQANGNLSKPYEVQEMCQVVRKTLD